MENRHRSVMEKIVMATGYENDFCHGRKVVGTVGQRGAHAANFTDGQGSVGIFPQFSH